MISIEDSLELENVRLRTKYSDLIDRISLIEFSDLMLKDIDYISLCMGISRSDYLLRALDCSALNEG